MKTSADIGLAAAAITGSLGTPGDEAWAAAGDVIEALDRAGRLKTIVIERRCSECGNRYHGPGHMCPRCRQFEDGHATIEPEHNESDVA